MKKLLLIALIAVSSAFASDYEIFESKTIDWSQVNKRETIFIGGWREYQKQLGEELSVLSKEGAFNAGNGALTGLSKASNGLAVNVFSKAGQGMAAGAVINMAVSGGIEALIGAFATDIKYIRIDKITMKDGSVKTAYKMIVLSMEKKLTPEQAIELIKGV